MSDSKSNKLNDSDPGKRLEILTSQVSLLKEVATFSTDFCHIAQYIALSDPKVMDKFKELLADPDIQYDGISCWKRNRLLCYLHSLLVKTFGILGVCSVAIRSEILNLLTFKYFELDSNKLEISCIFLS